MACQHEKQVLCLTFQAREHGGYCKVVVSIRNIKYSHAVYYSYDLFSQYILVRHHRRLLGKRLSSEMNESAIFL